MHLSIFYFELVSNTQAAMTLPKMRLFSLSWGKNLRPHTISESMKCNRAFKSLNN